MTDFELMPVGTRAAMRELTEAVGQTLDKDFGIWSSPGMAERRSRLFPAWEQASALLAQPSVQKPSALGLMVGDDPRGVEITSTQQPVAPIIGQVVQASGSGVPCDYGAGSDEFPSAPPLCGV
jgi:hypothetical protein